MKSQYPFLIFSFLLTKVNFIVSTVQIRDN